MPNPVEWFFPSLWPQALTSIVRSLTIRRVMRCAHDVVVACCLAMAEVWVRLPLGASFRVWDSLAVRLRRKQESFGSNPTTLTPIAVGPVLVRAGTC